MVTDLDACPILFQATQQIGPTETASELSTRLSEVGAEALVEALALLEEGAVQEVEQDHSRATFAPKVNREMARVEWTRSAVELSWHLRGLDSVPGAWTTLAGDSVKLYRPEPEPRFVHGETPGTVLGASSEEGLLVACGTGALRIGEVQSAGKRRMAVAEWLPGHPIEAGTRFE
jgi:methionyl-tRNA formyltransferase